MQASRATRGLRRDCSLGLCACLAALVALGLSSCRTQEQTELTEGQGGVPLVRVRLAGDSLEAPVAARGKFQIYDLADGRLIHAGQDLPPGAIAAQGNLLMLSGASLGTERVAIVAEADGTIEVRGRPYRGQMRCFAVTGRVVLVNALEVESYLAGVVGSEMPDKWDAAALAAQAVAARSYALYHMKQPGRAAAYDVTDSSAVSQAYAGLRGETEKSQAAVRETRGLVLAWNDAGTEKVLEALFHSTCGGHTLAIEEVWPSARPREALRGAACPYCSASPSFRWTVRINAEMLRQRLVQAAPTLSALGAIQNIGLRKDDLTPNGRVRAVTVWHAAGRPWSVPVALFRQACGPDYNVRSDLFAVSLQGWDVLVSGRGYGHGVGLCQYGAAELARQGKSAEEILCYYYPGTRLVRVY